MDYPIYIPAGDSAFLVKFGKSISLEIHQKIRGFLQAVKESEGLSGFILDVVPSYADVLVYYNSEKIGYKDFLQFLKDAGKKAVEIELPPARLVEIPVCYGGTFGEDIELVAKHNKLKPADVIEIHSSLEYLVYMLGFTPGFSYLGGMDERIATPRKKQPRKVIPAGSVGIAGGQTGIYPIESPGGWQLIGRTPLQLFNPINVPVVLLQTGDRIKFKPITEEEFIKLTGR